MAEDGQDMIEILAVGVAGWGEGKRSLPVIGEMMSGALLSYQGKQ